MKFRVTKKVTIEYVWEVEAESAKEAIAYAEDLGERNATEMSGMSGINATQPRAQKAA